MKITAIKTFMTRDGNRPRALIKVETDEGLYGWGEAYSHGPDLAIAPTIDYIFESDFVEPVRLLPVRFKHVKRHEWQPKHRVVLKVNTSKSLEMLVDSGADFSLIPRDSGIVLGYELAHAEHLNQAEGIGGSVKYVLRDIEIQLDSYTFTAPVAWMQTEAYQDVLLGREVVFDLFDIEFKQADEKIVFKKRNDSK